MKVEVLFPEYCNLYADIQNMNYLKECLDYIYMSNDEDEKENKQEAEFIYTSINDELQFLKGDVDLVYMGSMTERVQEKVIKKLSPHKDKIKELINKKKVFLFTGNAMEVMGNYIEDDDNNKIEALKIFDMYSKRDMMHRYSDLCYGNFVGMKICGFKATFSETFLNNKDERPFMEVKMGIGNNKKSKKEGIHKNNFIGTYLIGPILILNPDLTKYILSKMGVENIKLKYEDEIYDAYNLRLKEFSNLANDK